MFVWGSGYSADLWIRVPKATGRERKGKLLGALRAPPAWDGEPESQDTAVRLSLQREESWRWRGAPRECRVGENSLHPELQRTALPRPQRTLAQALFWVGQ